MKRKTMQGLWPLGLVVLLVICLASGVQAKGKPPSEAGNNLSYPVIWAEGVAKTLPGLPGMIPELGGIWWYQWGTNGTDPDVTPASCMPDPDDNAYCDDGLPGTVGVVPGTPPADNPQQLVKAYVQKDSSNVWQAFSVGLEPVLDPEVNVDLIDWGDNLESVDWYTRSQVRTEVVLFEDSVAGDAELHGWPLLPEYEMRHVYGWGIDEVHGLAADKDSGTALLGPGTRATVYSHCARLTIQKLLVPREDLEKTDLTWMPTEGWVTTNAGETLINPPIYNMAVYQGGDGPGYYSAEINVKGRVIYGYTWNVRRLNEGAGDYRITFSFDTACDGAALNTFFTDGITEIIQPAEEVVIEAEPEGGGVAVLDFNNNLTYMDVRILQKGGGGGNK